MPRGARPATLDELPLFASDREIAEAVVGRERADEFLRKLPVLENDRFPKLDGFYGGRYVPAVKAFFEGRLGPASPGGRAVTQDRPENPAAWTAPRSKRRA